MLYGVIKLDKHWLGNVLLADGTKPLQEPILTDHQWRAVAFYLRAVWQEVLKIPMLDISLKITNLILEPNLQGTNELMGCKMLEQQMNINLMTSQISIG